MIKGSIVALITPMNDEGAIDYEALAKLVEFHVENKTDGIVAVGTTGESATLTRQEHIDVVAKVVECTAGRCPVIAGTGSNSTAEAIDYTKEAKRVGADACLLISPYFNKPTQEGLYLHHKAIAEAVDIPQILYNVPGRTASDMLASTVQRLSEITNIVGIKEATGDLQRAQEIIELCGPDFALYSGDDAITLEMTRLGGAGVISVTSNVAPRAMHDMCHAALNGDFATAELIDKKLSALHRDLFVESNPIPVKWSMSELGLAGLGIRLPLTVLSEPHRETVRRAMQAAGVL